MNKVNFIYKNLDITKEYTNKDVTAIVSCFNQDINNYKSKSIFSIKKNKSNAKDISVDDFKILKDLGRLTSDYGFIKYILDNQLEETIKFKIELSNNNKIIIDTSDTYIIKIKHNQLALGEKDIFTVTRKGYNSLSSDDKVNLLMEAISSIEKIHNNLEYKDYVLLSIFNKIHYGLLLV